VGGIVVQVVPEAAVPPCLVLAQVAAELAPASGDVKGQDLRPATRDDLLDQAGGKVADVDHDRDGGVGLHAGGQRGPGAGQDPKRPVFPQVPGRPDGRAAGGDPRGQRLGEEGVDVKGGGVTGSFSDPRDPSRPGLPVVIILHAGHACGAGRTWPDRTAGVTAAAIRPPADAALLTHAEQATSGSWPEELRTWYVLADGTLRTPAG
jgi:hypothetical protein